MEHVLNLSIQLLQEIKRKHMNQARCLSTNAVSLSRQKCFVLRRVSCCNRESSGFELAYRSFFFGCKQRIGWGLAVSRSPFATTVAHQLKKSDQGTDRKLSRSVALFQITFFFPWTSLCETAKVVVHDILIKKTITLRLSFNPIRMFQNGDEIVQEKNLNNKLIHPVNVKDEIR